MPGTNLTHSRTAQTFHWLTAILVLIAFIASVGGPESRVYSVENASALRLHETLGTIVFILTCLRLLWRAVDTQPAPVAMPDWMQTLSKLVHWALFALLLLTPVTAVLGAWMEGHALTPFGLAIQPMIGESKVLGATISDIHGMLGDAIIWLAGLHAVAAIYHHIWLRDEVLTAMTPWLKRRS